MSGLVVYLMVLLFLVFFSSLVSCFAVNSPLSTAFTETHRLRVVISLSFASRYFLFFPDFFSDLLVIQKHMV